ncbi:hypothetical protein [Paradesertivirga mongoliensis]|uniref:hypothetical protein n=1 Tax=Paradesertivirga mongoliensis TaxID=2100740 RepID=UPI00210E5092|nr:hypothetical protein [Pedobacter mongoliensis]
MIYELLGYLRMVNLFGTIKGGNALILYDFGDLLLTRNQIESSGNLNRTEIIGSQYCLLIVTENNFLLKMSVYSGIRGGI